MYSLHVTDGDLVIDGRGKVVVTEGNKKVSNEIDYNLSTSPFLLNLVSSFHTNSPTMNEFALRDAILKVMNQMIKDHAENPRLPNNERIKRIEDLQIEKLDSTSFKFYLSVTTYAGSIFDLRLEKML